VMIMGSVCCSGVGVRACSFDCRLGLNLRSARSFFISEFA
jgi:hypothetical protein